MSQTTTAPESGTKWRLPGHGGDTLNLPSPPGDVELKSVTQSPGTEIHNMKQLLNEFKGLHEQRLRWLELDTTATPEELLQKKEDFLRSYVNDLTDQNQVLVQTIEDLQTEADHKLSSSGTKPHTSDGILDDPNRRRAATELGRHLRHLRSEASSTAHLARRTGRTRSLDMEEGEEHAGLLNRALGASRATQDSPKRTSATKEKRAQQLVQDDARLKESLTSLQSKLQTSERTLSDTSASLDQTKSGLSAEGQRKQQIQDQLQHGNKEVERLQRELTHQHRTAERKMQRRERKMCVLARELAESKRQHTDCQKELLQRERDVETLSQERDGLRAKMEDQSRECVHLNQTGERLEADLAQSHKKLHLSHLEVRSRDQFILQLRDEMKTAARKHQETQEQVAALEGEVRHLTHEARGHQEEAYRLSEKVRGTERLQDQKEREQQQLRDELRISQQQAETFEGKLKKQQDEMELLQLKLKGTEEELKDASVRVQEQKETVAIFKQKYTTAIEKVHSVQGRVEHLEEELRYSQQQLRESQSTAHSMKREQVELERRYQEKAGQWESSQEALDELTDELQASQNLLSESQQKLEHFKSLSRSLQEQVDTFKQQKLMLECDLRLHQQSHSHSDEEYLSLRRHEQQLQRRCAGQVERIAECEKAILQMKSELERQNQEKAGLKQSLAASHCTHLSSRSQLEQEVTRLKNEVTRLELELAGAQKASVELLRRSEEELREARREAAARSRDADAQRGEARRLQEELRREEGKARSAAGEKRSLSACVRRLGQELEELRGEHQVTVEDLAARAEEARRMEGCLNEGKLAEEKIRSVAARLEAEAAALRGDLQRAVNQRLEAAREKQDAREQVDTLRSELEATRADNANLCHESQLVMTNVSCWITEQKASNESLAAQMKAQNKVLLIVAKEKEHLQEANDTLKVEVRRLREVADERERDAARLKAQIRDRGIQQDERTMKNQSCVALNLSKIEEMQTRLRSNLEAIGMLNQQLNALGEENERLRRQLEEERSVRRRAERLLPPPPPPPLPPPTSQCCSSIHLPVPLSARPPPPSTFLPGDRDSHPSRAGRSWARESKRVPGLVWSGLDERPGSSAALPPPLEDARGAGRTGGDPTK